jgi:mannose-6-phosphate isomerase-like protein (cupin superfamily)
MNMRLKRLKGNVLTPALVWLLSACAPTPYLFLQYGSELKPIDLAKVLAENPLGANENVKIMTLGQGQTMSHHMVQIRDGESPHMHKTHDGTVVLIRGKGYLMMDNRRIELSAGDMAHIPRGAVHYFVNTAGEPAAAFVVFSPPFDGKDVVPVKKP